MKDIKEALESFDNTLGLSKLGFKTTIVYHCNRCDYLWFPKDFDTVYKDPYLRDIFNLPPPKGCARCKSKQWNQPRKRKRGPSIPIAANETNTIINDGMLTMPRLKAAARNTKRRYTQFEPIIKQIGIIKGQQEKPVITIQHRKKKKKLKV